MEIPEHHSETETERHTFLKTFAFIQNNDSEQ